jgi:hypothetical protein
MTERSRDSKGWRPIGRALVAFGAAALVALGVAASANAVQAPKPFHLELNRGELRLGSYAFNSLSGELATFDGEIDPATGELTVSVEGGALPTFDTGVLSSIQVQEPVTGTFDETTGELEMTALVDLHIGTYYEVCSFQDFEWTFSSSNTFGPLHGAPFVDGLDGAGAIVASWEDLPQGLGYPDPEICNEVRGLLGGPGGLRLERGAELGLKVRPRSRTVGQGDATLLNARVENTGRLYATGVEVCVRVPKRAIRVKECLKLGALAPGETTWVEFWPIAMGKAEPKPYRLRFRATASGDVDPVTAQATLSVKGK